MHRRPTHEATSGSVADTPGPRDPFGEWLDYFRGNALRETMCAGADAASLSAPLRAALARSLGAFYLGEAGEGRIVQEVRATRDPAFGAAAGEAIGPYIREEWRHAAELRSILAELGAALAEHAWSERLIRRGRRLLGLRLKILTIGAAEVAGVVYYSLLAERIDAPSIAAIAARIAREERRHLELVRELLAHAASEHPWISRQVDRTVMKAAFATVAACGAVAVSLGHRELLGQLASSELDFFRRCIDVLGQGSPSTPPLHV